MTIKIVHNHADGTLIYGTVKGDGVFQIAKRHRFRYFPSISQIGIQQSRDQLAKRWQIDGLAKDLRAAGFEVEVEIDDTPRDRAEVKADVADRLDARYEKLSAAAARHNRDAQSRYAAAEQISERFAGGQPILVGHHSERRARRDHDKMDNHMGAAVAASAKAEHAAAAASVVGQQAAYRDRPAVITRRIAKTEAELRKIQHYIDGTAPANDWRGAYYAPERTPASGGYLAQLESRKAFQQHQLAADREALEEHKAAGWIQWDKTTVHKGDTVHSSHWWDKAGVVTRVNPKTVTVDCGETQRSYNRFLKVPYETIKRVECPHEATVTAQVKAPPLPKRDAPAVEAVTPVAKVEPVVVDASFEYFPSPAAVVERIIDAAEIEPGMTVLEPSAGAGAIAVAAEAAGATVDCIEYSYTLAELLRRSGVAPGVRNVDFLTADPAPTYDRVLMNPPFRNQADIKHVTHALAFLKPGGRVVAVMSPGAEFRTSKIAVEFRKVVADRGGWIERLPADSFEQSGTNVATVLAVIPRSEVDE